MSDSDKFKSYISQHISSSKVSDDQKIQIMNIVKDNCNDYKLDTEIDTCDLTFNMDSLNEETLLSIYAILLN